MPKIEFLFDFGSPNAYLSHLVIPGIEKRHGVKFDYLPVLLGGVFERYVDEVYRHMWADPKKLDDPSVLRAALIESELPADRLFELVQTAEVKDALLAETQRAVERGTFGSPTFFVDGEIYFGKDRLRDVEEAIAAAP